MFVARGARAVAGRARSVAHRAWLHLRIATLRYRAHENEVYIAQCARDGLVESLAIAEWRRQVQTYRAEQARLTSLLHPLPRAVPPAQASTATARP